MKLVAVFAYRYDFNLVPDLLKNLEDMIDDYIAWDDRKNNEIWYHEGYIRQYLIYKAKSMGADWILGIDPDERFEKSTSNQIRQLIKRKEKIVYVFNFRELWTPNKYRVDGVWGQKTKAILFPTLPDQDFMNLRVHSGWFPINNDYKWINTGINLYHLKMIIPKNREERRDVYKILDPENKIQSIGYDYLTDETDIHLEEIPKGKEYYPPYRNE